VCLESIPNGLCISRNERNYKRRLLLCSEHYLRSGRVRYFDILMYGTLNLTFTHTTYCFPDRIDKNPKFKSHFRNPNGGSIVSFNSKISIYGRFLLKAWEQNLEGVELQAGLLAFRACLVILVLHCMKLTYCVMCMF